MKKRLLVSAAVIAVLVGISIAYSLPTAGQQPAPQVQRSQVNVTRVKPDMVDEFIDFQIKQTVPALKKAGVPRRDLYQSTLGPLYEFRSITPITSLADRDTVASPIEKALGAAGYKEYNAAVRKLITSQQTYVTQSIADASYDPNPNAAYKILVLSVNRIAPGRNGEYMNYLKNDLLPVEKKAQVKRWLVSQVVYGGDRDEYRLAWFVDKFAGLDSGTATERVLGVDGAVKMREKVAGIVRTSDRSVYMLIEAASYRAAKSSTN